MIGFTFNESRSILGLTEIEVRKNDEIFYITVILHQHIGAIFTSVSFVS